MEISHSLAIITKPSSRSPPILHHKSILTRFNLENDISVVTLVRATWQQSSEENEDLGKQFSVKTYKIFWKCREDCQHWRSQEPRHHPSHHHQNYAISRYLCPNLHSTIHLFALWRCLGRSTVFPSSLKQEGKAMDCFLTSSTSM
jgi:hypothetical protein